MRYAKVVLGLPVDELFDYSIPEYLNSSCSVGCRVRVSFGRRNLIGYVVGVSLKTKIRKVKPINRLIDVKPILDGNFLKLTEMISDYYCSSWGQAIEAALPVGVRKGLVVDILEKNILESKEITETVPSEARNLDRFASSLPACRQAGAPFQSLKRPSALKDIFLQCGNFDERSKIYYEQIDVVLSQSKSVLILAPEIKQCLKLFSLMKAKYPDKRIEVTYRKLKIKDELSAWEKARNGCVDVLIGTRAAVFSPLPNLGLIIIEQEDSYGYKEEQSPYYQARDVGLTRARLEDIPLVLSFQAPSLDAHCALGEKKYSSIVTGQLSGENRNFSPHLTPPHLPLVKGGFLTSSAGGEGIAGKYSSIDPAREDFKQAKITIVNMKQYGKGKVSMLFSPVLEDKLNKAISAGKKALIFINRKGYASFAHCQKCGFVLSCDECSSKLIFHFEVKKLVCSSCGFKKDLLRICPSCNSQYIKYSGFGIEKAVSQLNLYFPQAKIVRLDKDHQDIPPDFQILVATEKIFHSDIQPRFDMSAVIDLDSALNIVDFRNNEKLYRLLYRLKSLTIEDLIIQTRIPEQYQNNEFLNLELNKLFDRELKERKELRLPPYTHLTHINLRGKKIERTKSAALELYEKLKDTNKDFEIFEPVESIPSKLRGNFRFHILLKTKNQLKLSKFLKKQLKKIRPSGVILTVEVDPER